MKPAVLVIEEAAGRKIRQLRLEEPFVGSEAIDLVIEFQDGTQVAIDINVRSQLSFDISHLGPDPDGEMEPIKPIKKSLKGSIRALVKKQRKRSREKDKGGRR